MESIIEAELMLGHLKVTNVDENWGVKQHLGQIVILLTCYGGYTVSSTYLLQKMNVADDDGATDYKLVVTTYSIYLYAFLCVIDLVSSVSFVVRRFKMIQRILEQLNNV